MDPKKTRIMSCDKEPTDDLAWNLSIASSNLSQDDKSDALEEVEVLANAGGNPDDGAMKSSKEAIWILRNTTTSMPSLLNWLRQLIEPKYEALV